MTAPRCGFVRAIRNGLTNLANALLQKKELPEAIEHYRASRRASALTTAKCVAIWAKRSPRTARATSRVAQFREACGFARTTRMPPTVWATLSSSRAGWRKRSLFSKGDRGSTQRTSPRTTISPSRSIGAVRATPPSREFRRTLRLDPRHVDAHNNLAIALLKQVEAEDAIAEWQAALQHPAWQCRDAQQPRGRVAARGTRGRGGRRMARNFAP